MGGSTLVASAAKLTRQQLAAVATPPGTATHRPAPHAQVVEPLVETLSFRHIAVVKEEFAVSKDFQPVPAKHSKNFSLQNALSIGVDQMRRDCDGMRQQVKTWRRFQFTGPEVSKHLTRPVHNSYLSPRNEEFRPRTLGSLSNLFTSLSRRSRVRDVEVDSPVLCGAGFQPAAGLQPAFAALVDALGRPVGNRPQVENLPHKGAPLSGIIYSMRHLAWLLALAAPAGAQSLEALLRARISGFPGAVSLYAKNLDTGAAVGIG
jgi:hypothetical protein